MERFVYKDQVVEYNIVYRKRKTVEIRIEYPDKVLVRAPVGLDKIRIQEILESKRDWILEKLELIKGIEPPPEKQFISGEEFLYLGQAYTLAVLIDEKVEKPVVRLDGRELVITAPVHEAELLRTALQNWYGKQTLKAALELMPKYTKIIGRKPDRLKISTARKRWGSCSSKGNVLLNWRLAMAPLSILEYVLVHELCHLVHMNHSREYWDLVESVLPDYQERLGWLKANGAQLDI